MRSILGIDTSGRFGSVALVVGGSVRGWEILPPGGHSSGLSHAVERLLEGGTPVRALDGIAVVSGPGSFTGLRIGLGWAKGVCAAAAIPLALVPAHEANAHRHRGAAVRIATLLPGERGSISIALWSGEGPCLFGPEQVREAEIEERLRANGKPERRPGPAGAREDEGLLVVAPDLSATLRDRLTAEGFRVWRETPEAPPPAAVAAAELGGRAIEEGRAADPATAAPVYGRAPNARRPGA